MDAVRRLEEKAIDASHDTYVPLGHMGYYHLSFGQLVTADNDFLDVSEVHMVRFFLMYIPLRSIFIYKDMYNAFYYVLCIVCFLIGEALFIYWITFNVIF